MLHGILEEDQVHDSVGIVVVSKGFSETRCKSSLTWEAIIQLIIEGGDEVSEDQRFRVGLLVEFRELSSGELLLCNVCCEGLERLQVLWADQTITVDTLTLVSPQLNQVVRLLDGLWGSSEHTLEDCSQVTDIEFVMEVDGGLLERSFNFRMQVLGTLNHERDQLLHVSLVRMEMLVEESIEDREE